MVMTMEPASSIIKGERDIYDIKVIGWQWKKCLIC